MKIFHPGCTLRKEYRPLVEKVALFLDAPINEACCRSSADFTEDTLIITACPSCENFFNEQLGLHTATLWEVLPMDLPYPDYGGRELSLHDPCKKLRPAIYEAVRKALQRMNIKVREAELNRANSPCCNQNGSSEAMRASASRLPTDCAAVYCTGCLKGVRGGGKESKHLLELLLGE